MRAAALGHVSIKVPFGRRGKDSGKREADVLRARRSKLNVQKAKTKILTVMHSPSAATQLSHGQVASASRSRTVGGKNRILIILFLTLLFFVVVFLFRSG